MNDSRSGFMWWIDEPLVKGSSNPSDGDLERLRGQGFRFAVSLLEENEQLPLFMLVCDLVVDDLARCWNLHDADPLGLGYV